MDRWRDEFERLRRLVPERPDWHLNNWGLWRRSEQFTQGYDDHSTCLENMGGCAAEESGDHLFEREIPGYAEISNVVLEGMELRQRLVISQVYESSVFRFRCSIDAELVGAAEVFWERGLKRGLV